MPVSIDINGDAGESYGRWILGDDASFLPHVSSVNIACGFHGGDPATMRQTVRIARQAGIAIGAHPDPHFARRLSFATKGESVDVADVDRPITRHEIAERFSELGPLCGRIG